MKSGVREKGLVWNNGTKKEIGGQEGGEKERAAGRKVKRKDDQGTKDSRIGVETEKRGSSNGIGGTVRKNKAKDRRLERKEATTKRGDRHRESERN